MNRNRHTPWGFSDQAKEEAPGVVCYQTPSHGGYHVSGDALASMPPELKAVGSRAEDGGYWFEEDCEACAVILAFPDATCPHFTDREKLKSIAERTVERYWPENFAKYKKSH